MTTSVNDSSYLHSPYWSQPTTSNSLNHEHIAQALNHSSDDGETLVFSKLDLTDISVDAAEELATKVDANNKGMVKRIAMGHNRLSTLPTELALLTHLRYLNLRHNNFSTFPRVLTLIQSLDTLDISHNNIRRLPNEPGNLINLRVFCFSRNKISRLPSYLPQFHKLEVFRVDRNPIEWPPPTAIEYQDSEDVNSMKEWIRSVQNWIETECSKLVYDDHERGTFDKSIEDSLQFNEYLDRSEYHGRSHSVASNTSLPLITESPRQNSPPETLTPNRPPPLHLGILRSTSPEPSPPYSFDGISPASDYDLEIPSSFDQMQAFEPPPLHSRTASYAEGVRHPLAPTLLGNKSLPDLRNVHSPTRNPVSTPPLTRSLLHFTGQDSLHRSSSYLLSIIPKFITPSFLDASDVGSVISLDEKRISVATERNYYFRRLSKLPLSNPLPQYLANFTESARSLLFAMCQIYQSLEQYAALVIDDRFSVVLRKVLDPAHFDMMQFIQALERFDSMSRSSLPPPTACRNLLERCRDCAMAFGKAVNVLVLRLQVDPGDDLRFSRWMLLEMYAATVEIAGAWKSMQSHSSNLRSYVRQKDSPVQLSESVSGLDSPSQHTLRVGISARTRTARRHAGSFSSKDVEIGKKLPSYDMPSSFRGGVLSGPAPHIPTLRTPKRQATAPVASSMTEAPLPLSLWNSSEERSTSHIRHDSQKSDPSYSPSSSPFKDSQGNSKRKIDFEALNAIQKAVETAPKVWDMVADTLLSRPNQNEQAVHAVLGEVRSVTMKLSEIISKMHSGDLMSEKKLLQEDAQLFLKVVVRISGLVKTYGVMHSVPSALRTSIHKLAKMTEEFAILLHVSSFTSPPPRSFSPIFVNPMNLRPDGRLASNLSRTRSARSSMIKIPHPALNGGPHSAVPTQSFKILGIELNRRFDDSEDVLTATEVV